MFKFVRSMFLLFLVISLAGCYETVQVTRDQMPHIDTRDDMTAFVDNSGTVRKYSMPGGRYKIVNDTLVGEGTVTADNGEVSQVYVAIPVSRVMYGEVDRLSVPRTLLLAGGAIAMTYAIIWGAGASSGSTYVVTPPAPPK